MSRFGAAVCHNPSESRRADRRRVLLSGIIAYGDGAYSLKCTIKSISESGARITISSARQELPSIIYLINLRDQSAYQAKTVWHKAQEFGLSFITIYSIAKLPTPELAYLKHLWLASTTV